LYIPVASCSYSLSDSSAPAVPLAIPLLLAISLAFSGSDDPCCPGSTRIQEEQPKVNLHTSTRNVELKNQDISEENNQITKTIGSPFYKLISNSVKTQNNKSAQKSDVPIAIPRQEASENGKMPSAKIPSDERTQIPINETEPSIDILSSHRADSVRTPINDESTKMNNGELLQTLKMRLVKGEISKEEYLKLNKSIES
jgi:hypothetical protein